jgi:hypothetical protein
MAEIEHWFRYITCDIQDITATRTAFGELIRTSPHSNNKHEHPIRLPLSLVTRETGIFLSKGFENLSTATPPITVENERSLVFSLIAELNNMFALELCESPSVDRCLEANGEVFEEDLRPRVVLVGASHLRRLGKHLPDEK